MAKPTEQSYTLELVIPIQQNMELNASKLAENLAQSMDFTPEQCAEISMALLEGCINAFEHAQSPEGKVFIKFIPEPDQLKIILHDNGIGFDPKSITKPDISGKLKPGTSKRGWGIHLMEKLMDKMEIDSDATGTTITLIKKKK